MANGTILPITKVGTSMMIGDYAGGNYTEFNDEGTQILHGNAIAWVDMYGDVTGKKLFTTTGRIDTDWDNNCIKFQNNGSISNRNDRLIGNVQNNHQFKLAEGATLIGVIFHFHWFQETIDKTFRMAMETRLLKNGQSFDKDAAWTHTDIDFGTVATLAVDDTNGGDAFPFSLSGGHTSFNQITFFPVLNLNLGLSDTIQYRVARTDSETGDVLMSFFDTHLPVNGFGSDLPLKKTK